jgi:CRISPR-associated protein Cas1
MECVRSWLLEKLMLQESFLRDLLRYRSKAEQQRWQPKLSQLQGLRAKLETAAPEPATFRGLEGSAGRILYYTLGQLLPDRYRFVRRSRRPAQDAFNAFLNYAYALLYVRVETALLEAGLNPYIGFMHRDDYQYKSLVYDFIEPFRITTIRAVYQLFARHKVSGQHVRKEPDGSVWLSTEGKRLLLPHLKTAYEEKTEVRWQMRMTEAWHIRRRASHFAQDLLQEAEIEETAA